MSNLYVFIRFLTSFYGDVGFMLPSDLDFQLRVFDIVEHILLVKPWRCELIYIYINLSLYIIYIMIVKKVRLNCNELYGRKFDGK